MMKKGLKILMIFCTLFSQFSGVINVYAEEVANNGDNSNLNEKQDGDNSNLNEDQDGNNDNLNEDQDGNNSNLNEDQDGDNDNLNENQDGNNDNLDENNGKVLFNGVEVSDSFSLSSGTLTILYDGEDDFSINTKVVGDENSYDFTGYLYGSYNFEIVFGETTKNVTVVYGNDSNDALLSYKTGTIFKDGVAYIPLGAYKESVIGAISLEHTTIEETETGIKLTSGDVSAEYTFSKVGDLNQDNEVSEEDLDMLILSVLNYDDYKAINDINADGSVDVQDVSVLYATLNDSEFKEVDNYNTIDVVLSSNVVDTLNLGDKFNVNMSLNGFDENTSIDVIFGHIDFNENISLSDVSTNSMKLYKNDNNDFILVGDLSTSEKVLNLVFDTVASTNSDNVNFESLKVYHTGDEITLTQDSNFINYAIDYTNNKGGDEETTDTSNTTNTTVETVASTTSNNVVYVKNTLNSDNYISSLTIEGYDIDFDSYNYVYTIDVDSDVKSLDLSVILDNSLSSYVINGNENFVSGENIVTIVVTAEDGSTRTYTIKVNKAEEKKTTTKKASKSSDSSDDSKSGFTKGIVIFLIVLVIIGLIYLIFKDDSEE